MKCCTYNYFTCCYIEITVHPQSVDTTLNSTVIFTCEIVPADMIHLQINNMSVSNVNNRRIINTSGNNFNCTKRQVLLAIAFQNNNNNNISCRIINNSNGDIVALRIQGELMLCHIFMIY